MSVLDLVAASPGQLLHNRAIYEHLCADPVLAHREERIETDACGRLLMSPPPRKPHALRQTKILHLLRELMGDFELSEESGRLGESPVFKETDSRGVEEPWEGGALVEAPISTADGVKAADVVWCSREREALNPPDLYELAPEICVEVLSPSNREEEMVLKKALYFGAGAEEVWFCQTSGEMQFFCRAEPDQPLAASRRCPEFPRVVR